MRRAVITGLGILSPIGNDLDTFSGNLKAGKHGITLEEWFPGQSAEKNAVARIRDFDVTPYIDKKTARRTDPVTQYAVYAAMKAMEDAGTDFKDLDPFRCGVVIASGIGGIQTTEEQILTYHNKNNTRVSVFTIPMMIGNMTAGAVAIKTGFKGANYTTVSACASSNHAIGDAFRMIKYGQLDCAIAGGAEACSIGFALSAFNNMHALTRSTDPDRASIPFDKERSGFVLGEGSGIVVIEEYEHAVKRGAKIYCEIAGYGATCDAFHETSPDPEGTAGAKAIELALEEAGVPRETINYCNAHGTSTSLNDSTETKAIKAVFGEHAYKMAINSTKSMTGHLLGAAGGLETVATALQMKYGFVHPTVGLKVDDPECDLDYCKGESRGLEITGAVSNSLGFGGHNAALCFLPAEN